MATATELQTQLDEVRAAISRLLADGQAWTQGRRSRTDVRLAELQAREEVLERRLARAKGGGIRTHQGVPIG